jgi:hypothetical protein
MNPTVSTILDLSVGLVIIFGMLVMVIRDFRKN